MEGVAVIWYGVKLILADSLIVPTCHFEERSDDPDAVGVVRDGSTHP